MSRCGVTAGSTEQGIMHHFVGYRRCLPVLLCVATLLLEGCHTKTTVQAHEKSILMPFQHSKDAIKCPRPDDPVHGVIATGSRPFDLLESDLVSCPVEGGESSVEPAWSVVAWYSRGDIYQGSDGKEFTPRQDTTLSFELLFQRYPTAFLDKSNGAPPPGTAEDAFRKDNATSLMIFNKEARETVHRLYGNWPSGIRSPASVRDAQLGVKSARVMKLNFARNDLAHSTSCKHQFCQVGVVSNLGEDPKPSWVNMDPTKPCKRNGNTGQQTQPTVAGSIAMDCFYYVVVHLSDNPRERATFDYRREYVGLHPHKKLCPLHDVVYLLLGFHLMQSDEPAWTWNTFWWKASDCDDTAGKVSGKLPCKDPCGALQTATPGTSTPRPLACETPWAFYAMDHQEYDETHVLAGDNLAAHFNPYIEDPQSKSNCIYCHARALYHDKKLGNSVDDSDLAKKLQTSAAMLPCFAAAQTAPQGPLVLPHQVPYDVNCTDATPTHFLWSLAGALQDRQSLQPE